MKWLVTLMLVCGGGLAFASGNSNCVQEYRKAYIEFGRTNAARYQDAADIYAIYFDLENGLIPDQRETPKRVAEFIKKGLESGSLCTSFGHTKTKSEILDDLLTELSK